ncbi:hypothetical protein [Corynebacterium epidermidicanis]|uniref:Uncharacterized protein n=1 Tax=Corynebacterium epidermidicanis TaxID=1050174 RepID=A0A0G3GRC9_9CORY|nr:hypothetical protein [Corynebacterium epidermidicanis]AKK03669.1 hypothetical protein CEPID_09115 [Corynebacterium epidermidicanis]
MSVRSFLVGSDTPGLGGVDTGLSGFPVHDCSDSAAVLEQLARLPENLGVSVRPGVYFLQTDAQTSCGFPVDFDPEHTHLRTADFHETTPGYVRAWQSGGEALCVGERDNEYAVQCPFSFNPDYWGLGLAVRACFLFESEQGATEFFDQDLSRTVSLKEPQHYGQGTMFFGHIADECAVRNGFTDAAVTVLGLDIEDGFTEVALPTNLLADLDFALPGGGDCGTWSAIDDF